MMRRRLTKYRITTRIDYSKDFCGHEVMIMMRRRRKGKTVEDKDDHNNIDRRG